MNFVWLSTVDDAIAAAFDSTGEAALRPDHSRRAAQG
jgi:hypothetical protein